MADAATAYAEETREPQDKLPQPEKGKARREALDDLFTSTWTEMLPMRPRWDTIGRAIMPDRPRWCYEYSTEAPPPPSYGAMMDSTPTRAARTLSSGMVSQLSSPAKIWFSLTTTDKVLDERQDVGLWIEDTVSRVLAVMDRSNYYAEAEQVYLDAALFGAAAMSIEADKKTVIRCRTHPIGSYAIRQDMRGRVNTFVRQWQADAFQIAGEFGTARLPKRVLEALKKRDRTSRWRVRHAIQPNREADARYANLDARRMEFAECYWLDDQDIGADESILHEGYYAEWPTPVPRWGPIPGWNVWSQFAPGFVALPDVLMLYEMRLQYLNALRKGVSPPTVSGAGFKGKKISQMPGANNASSAEQGDPQLKPLLQVSIPYDHVSAEMALTRQHVESSFYADIMMPMLTRLQNEAQQPTATQSYLARDEQVAMFGPVIEGFADQFHDPSIDRIFGIMWRAGLIAPPPEALAGQPLRVVLRSAMAQAQRSVGLAALDRKLQIVGAVSSMWGPTALDTTNPDELLRAADEMLGVPASTRRTPEETAAIRSERVAAQQQAAAAANAPGLAKAARDLSETRPSPENALGQLAGAGVA